MAVASIKPIQMGSVNFIFRILEDDDRCFRYRVKGKTSYPHLDKILSVHFASIGSGDCTTLQNGVNPNTLLPSRGHKLINHAIELIQVSALFNKVTIGRVTIHFTISEPPRQFTFRV